MGQVARAEHPAASPWWPAGIYVGSVDAMPEVHVAVHVTGGVRRVSSRTGAGAVAGRHGGPGTPCRGCMWRRGGGGRRVDVRLGGTGGGGGALEGVPPSLRRSHLQVGVPVRGPGVERCRTSSVASSELAIAVVGTSLMASRYGLAVPLGDRSCAASTSTSLVSSPSVRVDGVRVLMKFLQACAVTPSQVPVGAVRVRELDVLRAPVHQPGRQVRPRPPAWTCFGWPWRCTRSPRRCSATRSGPSPPPRWSSGCPRCLPHVA